VRLAWVVVRLNLWLSLLVAAGSGVSLSPRIIQGVDMLLQHYASSSKAYGCALSAAGVLIALAGGPRVVCAAKPRDLPIEVRGLLAGWKKNLGAVRSIEARVREHVQVSEANEAVDLEGRRFGTYTSEVRFWAEGDRRRADMHSNRTFAGGKVLYHLPHGEHIVPRRFGQPDVDALKRMYGTTETTTRRLVTDGKYYDYLDEGKLLMIGEPPRSESYVLPASFMMMVEGALASSRTLAQDLQALLRLGATVSPPQDLGKGRFLIRAGYTNSRLKLTRSVEYVLNASKGYTLESIRDSFTTPNGTFPFVYADFEYNSVGGIWVLSKGRRRIYNPDTHDFEHEMSLEVVSESLRINEGVDPSVFSVDSLGIAKGALVTDQITGEQYLYNDLPIDLKIAQVMAERDLYDAAGDALMEADIDEVPGGTTRRGSDPSGPSAPEGGGGAIADSPPRWWIWGTGAAGLVVVTGIVFAALRLKGRKQRNGA